MVLMKQYIEQLLIFLKDSVITALTVVTIFLGPIHELIFAVFLLCMLDFFTGIFAAYKTKVTITSKKMGDTFFKFILYGLAIIIFHYLDEHFVSAIRLNFADKLLSLFLDEKTIDIISGIKMSAGIAFLMVIRELKSIDENWEKSFQWSFIKYVKNIINLINKFKTTKKNEISE